MNRMDYSRGKQSVSCWILLGALILGLSPAVWSGYTGAGVDTLIAPAQAILPGSFWTPICVVLIDDHAGCDDDCPPVNFIYLDVDFLQPPVPAGTPPLQPGDIAAVALAYERSPAANFNNVYQPSGGLADPIISVTTLDPGSLSARLYIPDWLNPSADAEVDPPYQTRYWLLVATATKIQDSAQFYPSIFVSVDNYAPNSVAGFTFSAASMHVVNNIGDLRPIREGVNGSGIPLIRFDRAGTGEQPSYPGLFPDGSIVHPDLRATFSAVDGRVPEVWTAGSALEPVLGLELGGGYGPTTDARVANVNVRFQTLFLELISIGRRAELLSDGLDNDGDQLYLADNNLDDDFDGVIDNLSEGIDEESIYNEQFENRNDDRDYYLDHAGPDGVWGPNPAFFGIDDDPGVLGFYDVGIDLVYNDVGAIREQLDAYDTLAGDDRIFAASDERSQFTQIRLYNDDHDYSFDDAANQGINFPALQYPVGFEEGYDYGIDPIILDDGNYSGEYDSQDTVLYEGYSGSQNLFRGDRISNNDGDYYMIDGPSGVVDGLATGRSWKEAGWLSNRNIQGPNGFLPYYDEIYIDNPLNFYAEGIHFRFQLDRSDTLVYAGTNAWPTTFPAFYPDNDVRLYNDDGDYWVDGGEGGEEDVYDLGVDVVIFDSNGNGVFDLGEPLAEDGDWNENGRFDFGFDYVYHEGATEGIDTPYLEPFSVPADPTVFSSTANYMIGYAFARDPFTPPVLWTPDDIAAISALYVPGIRNMYEAAHAYLTQQFELGLLPEDPIYIVFVADDPDDGNTEFVPDFDPANWAASGDEIIYDNRFLGNPTVTASGRVPWFEPDDLYDDEDENGVYTFGDVILYRGGSLDDDTGIITPILDADPPEDGTVLAALVDEEPRDGNAPDGADGRDNDGDGEDNDDNPYNFAIADGIDNDGDSVDTDGDGYVDGLEVLFNTNPYDPLDVPPIDPVPPWVFVDEGIDEDTNFTPFGLGWNVEAGNPTGALIDEDGIVLDANGEPILDPDGDPIPAPDGRDSDGDGQIDEDLPNFVVSAEEIPLFARVDEERQDGLDNDLDGFVDEDIDHVPMEPLVDEEILDYFVDEPGGELTTGYFDFVKSTHRGAPLEMGTQGMFGPRFDPFYPSPSLILLGALEFHLSAEGDMPLDEYYVDFNANGVYDEARLDAQSHSYTQDECLFPGFDGIVTLQQGDLYSQRAIPVDNDGDGEDDDGNLLTPPRPDGIDNDGDSLDPDDDGYTTGQELWAGTYHGDPNFPNAFPPGAEGELAVARASAPTYEEPLPGWLWIDEGFNEDCGDSAFTFEDYEGSGSDYSVHGFQVYADDGDGWFDPATDTLISRGFSEIIFQPNHLGYEGYTGSPIAGFDTKADFPHLAVQISIPNQGEDPGVGNLLEKVDDNQFDYFVIMCTDDDDNDAGPTSSTVKGLSFGDDWTIKLGKYNFGLSSQTFAYSPNMFPQQMIVQNPMVAGRPNNYERIKANYGRLYMNDIIGFIPYGTYLIDRNDFRLMEERGGPLFGYPFVDATSSYLPLLGVNIAGAVNDNPVQDVSGGQTGEERLVSIRVNFINVDLEGDGVFEPTDLMPLAEDFGSGVALFVDSAEQGARGVFDYDIFNDQPVDSIVPISNPVWGHIEDPADPIVQAGGNYVVLRPTGGLPLPSQDQTPDATGYDFFVAIRTSESIDYHDTLRMFVRDGDIQFQNSRSVVNTHRKVDPVAANVPTFLSDLVEVDPQTGAANIGANSPPTAVVGLDMHDSNRTFKGQPSKLRSVRVFFDNVADGTGPLDGAFTPQDLLRVNWGPDYVLRQWSLFDPATGRVFPYGDPQAPSSCRIVSNNGVALYRDAPNSDTIGAFDDPMDPGVISPDTPVLLSGLEDWDFLGGFAYNVNLLLDPPPQDPHYKEGDEDTSPVDPNDPDPYEPLPDSTDGVFEGDDFFVVIRTSSAISFGDNFQVGVRVEVGNNLGGVAPITFYPPLSNSFRHPRPQTWPYSEAISSESLTTRTLRVPIVTITSYKDMVGEQNRQDSSSEPFPVFGVNVYGGPGCTETLTAVRVELRSIDGLEIDELNPLSADETSGLALYTDNPTAGIPGVFDPADIFVPIVGPVFTLNYFADHPGVDGIYGTYDDPGLPGVFDEGIDEVFLDDGVTPGIVDFHDTLIDDGVNDIQDVFAWSGATLYPLTDQTRVESQYTVFLRPAVALSIPLNDLGVDQGPDYFVVARTSPLIDYQDNYHFRLSRDGLYFTSGRSFASADVASLPVTTNVPTYLQDTSAGTFASVNDRLAVIAIHAVNSRPQPVTLGNLILRFGSVDNNNFTFTDLAPLRTHLEDGRLTSGISVWRNTNGNDLFDYPPELGGEGDTFIPLAGVPSFVGDGADPYSRFRVNLALDPGSPQVLLRREGLLEEGPPDFFVVLKASNSAAGNERFFVEILPGDVNYGLGAKDSGEQLRTQTISLAVNPPPFFEFLQPAWGAPLEEVRQSVYQIKWTDMDVNDNAEIRLFYFVDDGPPYPGEAELFPVTDPNFPLYEDPDGPGDRYDWDVGNVPAEVPLRILARVDDGFNDPLEVVSGSVIIFSEPAGIQMIRPATAEVATRDTFTVEWRDDDPDSNALIALYLDVQNTIRAASSPTSVNFATGIPEDPDGPGDTYEVPVAELLEQGLIQTEQAYYVWGRISDNVPHGEAGAILEDWSVSPGTLTPVRVPTLRITRPVILELVQEEAYIEWLENIPVGDDARIDLFWVTDTFGAPLDTQIDNGLEGLGVDPDDPALEGSIGRIVSASSSVLQGAYVWYVLNAERTGLAEGLPADQPVTIYAEITDERGEKTGTFSLGQFAFEKPKAEWPVTLRSPVQASPVVADVAGGSTQEIIVVASNSDLSLFNAIGGRLAGPIGLGSSGPGGVPTVESSPALIDLDAEDGQKELLVAVTEYDAQDRLVGALYLVPLGGGGPGVVRTEAIQRFALFEPIVASLANSVVSTPAVADIDGDGLPEAVIGTGQGELVAINLLPSLSEQWRVTINDAIQSSPAVGNVDGDAGLEIVIYTDSGNLYVLKSPAEGQGAPEVPQPLPLGTYPGIYAVAAFSPALGDVDGDGISEIVIGTPSLPGKRGYLYIINGEAWQNASSPVELGEASAAFTVAGQITTAPALADVNGNGRPDIVLLSRAQTVPGMVYAFSVEPVGRSLDLIFEQALGEVPFNAAPASSPVIGDYNPARNLFFGLSNGRLASFYWDAAQQQARRTEQIAALALLGSNMPAPPVVSDLDHNGRRDVVYVSNTSTGGFLHRVESVRSVVPDAPLEWPTFKHDNARTGDIASPLGMKARGDLNQDGRIDYVDLFLMTHHWLKFQQDAPPKGDGLSDLDANAQTDAADLILFMRYWHE